MTLCVCGGVEGRREVEERGLVWCFCLENAPDRDKPGNNSHTGGACQLEKLKCRQITQARATLTWPHYTCMPRVDLGVGRATTDACRLEVIALFWGRQPCIKQTTLLLDVFLRAFGNLVDMILQDC